MNRLSLFLVALLPSAPAIASPCQDVYGEDAVEQTALELEELGLRIAEETLTAVSELVPEAMNVATGALAAVNAELAIPDRALIGITGESPGGALCSHLQVDGTHSTLVTSIAAGMSAEKAGLSRYDIIVAINGSPRASMDALRRTLDRMETGDTLHLSIIRHGNRMEVQVPLLPVDPRADLYSGLQSSYLEALGQSPEGAYYQDYLRGLAESEGVYQDITSALAEARQDFTQAQAEIDQARDEVRRELEELRTRQRVDPRSEVDALNQLQELLDRESQMRNDLMVREAESEARLADLEARRAQLEAFEASRFLTRGERDTLVLPGGELERTARKPDSARLDRMEAQVDELHQRFDRLERMLDRALSDR